MQNKEFIKNCKLILVINKWVEIFIFGLLILQMLMKDELFGFRFLINKVELNVREFLNIYKYKRY